MFRCFLNSGIVIFTVFFTGISTLFENSPGICSDNHVYIENNQPVSYQIQPDKSILLDKINSAVLKLSIAKNTSGLLLLADSIQSSIESIKSDSLLIAEFYYYIGVCNLIANRSNEALVSLKLSVGIKNRLKITDNHYSKSFYNIGVAYTYLGDFIQVISYMQEYIRLATLQYGENSAEVADAYTPLIGAAIECNENKLFVDNTFRILGILSINKSALEGTGLSGLYNSIGVGYIKIKDYAKAIIYLEKAESILKSNNVGHDLNYINLINSMAITYGYLGFSDKEEEYFSKGIDLANYNNSFLAFNIINSYAIGLGRSGKTQKGEALLSGLVEKAKVVYGIDSRYYIEVLNNYAEYLLNYNKSTAEAINIYSKCINYLERHNDKTILRDRVLMGYAQAVYLNGDLHDALRIVQELLFHDSYLNSDTDLYRNPEFDSINVNNMSLMILRLKYDILWNVYSVSAKQEVLESAAGTSELIIALIDKIRINISEEDSRLVLGDRYRDSYLMAIRDFELCYRKTGNRVFLEKAFEFAEKSKVAGLLAATRELNAVQFHIPESAAEQERTLQREIGFYNAKISLENEKDKPDKYLLSDWNEKLLSAIKARDSLVLIFERDYPEYFTLKYNTRVPEMKNIPSIIGRNCNYLNYVVSDSLLYIFLINRKHQELLTFKTDSLLMTNLRDFRALLSDPFQSESARIKFIRYQIAGNDLYNILIEPVRKYFISDNLLISPDNFISYLPFETIISSKIEGDDIMYRKLNYLMKDYRISYTYSAAFMKEIVRRGSNKILNLVAFAPVYPDAINIDSLFMNRQPKGKLYDLPYARQEAEYVSGISGGKLYLNNAASETVFKAEAPKYNIIHLAMHTYLNDQKPMNSAMIFTQANDKPEDGLLYTYEVYGLPLKASMVVLSSCNTGTGLLSSGEGILSLARGFLYAGSRSVVMSMWEIEDKSGTEIIKMFYDNLKKGKSKNQALKKARSTYLKEAGQQRSHPYYWSSLVIYGDNAPVFWPWKTLAAALSVFLVITALVFYVRKRKYS
jgi:CHAT domain-containing protein